MGKCCDYNYLTGKARGCLSGEGCNKRVISGKRRKSFGFSSKDKMPKEFKAATRPSPVTFHPKKDDKPWLDAYEKERLRKKLSQEKTKETLQGRQRAVLLAYKTEHNVSNKDIAEMIGVHSSTVQKWSCEYKNANWELLAKIGITKPEGLE